MTVSYAEFSESMDSYLRGPVDHTFRRMICEEIDEVEGWHGAATWSPTEGWAGCSVMGEEERIYLHSDPLAT